MSDMEKLRREIAIVEIRLRAAQFVEGLKARRAGQDESRNPWRQCKNARWWLEGFRADPKANHGEIMFDAVEEGERPDFSSPSEEDFVMKLRSRFGATPQEAKTFMAIWKTNW